MVLASFQWVSTQWVSGWVPWIKVAHDLPCDPSGPALHVHIVGAQPLAQRARKGSAPDKAGRDGGSPARR